MNELLNNKVTIVTGASRGLGQAIARRLAALGARVVICGRNREDLDRVAEQITRSGGRALAVPTDLGQRSHIDHLVNQTCDHFGPAEILINNAGVGWYKPLVEHSPEEIDQTIAVNLSGLIHTCHAVLPKMIETGSGSIINIASDLGRRVIPNMAAYVAAKHGVMGFSGSLMREVKDKGIKVMTVTPGIIDTWFGGGQPGGREETWSLKPEVVAELVVTMLTQPTYVMMDEVAIHPMHQEM